MKKYVLCSFLVLSLPTFAIVGNETGNREIPTNPASELLKSIKEQRVFKIEKEVLGCPSIIQMKAESPFHDKVKEGDVTFSLHGYEKDGGGVNYKNFTHENNVYVYRPNPKLGKKEKTDGDCSIIAGIACDSSKVSTNKSDIYFERSANVLSLAMITRIKTSFKFDIKENKLTYTFKGNGLKDVTCSFVPAEELRAGINVYEANLESLRTKKNSIEDSSRGNAKPSTPNENMRSDSNKRVISK